MNPDFYQPTGAPGPHASGSSAAMRQEFNLIAAAFDKFPVLTGNAGRLVRIRSDEAGFDVASSIDGTPIGQTTRAAGAFTVADVSTALGVGGVRVAGRQASLWGITSVVGDAGSSLLDLSFSAGSAAFNAFGATAATNFVFRVSPTANAAVSDRLVLNAAGATFPAGVVSIAGNVTASSFLVGSQATTSSATFGFANGNGPGLAVYGKATSFGADAGSMVFRNHDSAAILTMRQDRGSVFAGAVDAPQFYGTFVGNATSASVSQAVAGGASGGNFNFLWAAVGGTPSFVLGSNNGLDVRAFNPAGFSVQYAATAPWAGISGRPTNVSQFANDAGYVTSIGSAAAGSLTGNTLAAGVTASSLTSLGPLTTLVVAGQSNFDGLLVAYNRALARGGSGPISATGYNGQMEVQAAGSGNAAMIAFHRNDNFAAYLGLDTDNVFKVGGWSMGGVSFALLHAGNYSSYAPTLSGAGASGTWNIGVSGNAATATRAAGVAGGSGGQSFNFAWAGQPGTPTYVFGSNDGVNVRVWQPATMSVNYAASAGSAASATSAATATAAGQLTHYPGRADATPYPVVWMPASDNQPAYSCSAVTVRSDIGRLTANSLVAVGLVYGNNDGQGLGAIRLTATTGAPSGTAPGDWTGVY